MKLFAQIFIGLFIFGNASISQTNFPNLINYQARLTSNNIPISGNVTVTFNLYDSIQSGKLLWTETQSNVLSQNGIISVKLGTVNSLAQSHFKTGNTFLETEVAGYGKLAPRQQFTAVPFALFASNTLKLLYNNDNLSRSETGDGPYELLSVNVAPNTLTEFIKVEIMASNASASNLQSGPIWIEIKSNGNTITSKEKYSAQNTNGGGSYIFWSIPITGIDLTKSIDIKIMGRTVSSYWPLLTQATIFGK